MNYSQIHLFFHLVLFLNQNPRTLLPKFYGLYCIQCAGVNICLAVMNNVMPRALHMHYDLKYDLRGSTYKRRASCKERAKFSPTFKDLDFQEMLEGMHFDGDTYSTLMKTMQRDCRVRPLAVDSLTYWYCIFKT